MKTFAKLTVLVALLGTCAQAADNLKELSMQDSISSKVGETLKKSSISISLNSATGKKVVRADITANRKTNAFGKNKNASCERAFVSALLGLQAAAEREGASGVANLRSFYKRKLLDKPGVYECAQGKLMVGVTIMADLVK